MNAIIFACLLAVAAARPDPRDDRVAPSVAREHRFDTETADGILRSESDVIALRADGEYSFDTETADGILRSESGVGSGPDGAVESQGTVAFTSPDGQDFELQFVSNAEGGYQPESGALPLAPAFSHPIPQFVLDQIVFAAEEDAAA